MSCESKNPGDVDFLKCDLIAQNRKLDIRPYVARIDVYESILASGVICEITVADATGIFSHFGNDIIDLEFTTYEDAPPVAYKFRIIRSGPGVSVNNEKAVIYRLVCVSEEAYKSMTVGNLPLVRSKDVLVEEAVLAMLNDVLGTEKDIYLEPTTGLHSVSSEGATPFEFIDMMREIAVSEQNTASAYVFYENKNGYHFKSLEYMIQEGLTAIGDKVYIYHNVANLDVTGSNWRTILGAKQIQVGNDDVAALIGGNKASATEFDINTGEFVQYDEGPESVFEVQTMNEGSVWIDTRRSTEYGIDGRSSTVIYDSSSDRHTVAEKENYLPYYITKFLTVIQHITVYGDTTVTVGDVIKVKFPQRTGLTDETGSNVDAEMDENLTGKYMVCKCRHVLIFGGDATRYYQAFEIVKDGLGGEATGARS